MLLAGQRVGDDRLPATTKAATLPWWMIGWISLISPILAHQAAYLGRWRASCRKVAAELVRGVTVP
jgi:hypothetical protein